MIIIIIIIIQIFISTKRHELADHIFCIPMSNCLIADTEVPENAHQAYRVKFLLNEMIRSVMKGTTGIHWFPVLSLSAYQLPTKVFRSQDRSYQLKSLLKWGTAKAKVPKAKVGM